MPDKDNWREQVLDFWFKELSAKNWFEKSDDLDLQITSRFRAAYDQVLALDADQHLKSGHDALAAVIAIDQFARNMFRDTPKAFAADPQALEIAKRALAARLDEGLTLTERQFLYMPFMHAEDVAAQTRCVELFGSFNDDGLLKFATGHKDIIDRFGRFPHRNEILGRPSTAEEIAFLNEPGSSY